MAESMLLLDRHDAVLLDLDGTVYRGARPITGVPETITSVRRRGVAVRFVTNNAAKAPSAVAEHLTALGVAADAGEVSTSAQAAAQVLRQRLPEGAAVLVVGTASLAAEVDGVGLRAVPAAGATDEQAERVDAVVQGHSPDTCWADLARACLAVRAGAYWVACNGDVTLPTERGELPGNGSMVAALRAATGAEPEIAGKPRPPVLRTAAESAAAGDPLVVGDRLDTDIAGATATGFASLAVLSGVATPAELLAAGPAERPRYLATDLTALQGKADELEVAPRPGWRVCAEDGVLVASSNGERDAVDLLRALCAAAWRHGTSAVRAGEEIAEAALAELGLV
ncbi:HAD superfamily hydrolase (TIGR01450 family) [Saccharomonospora amisosensis]|uniref:HAD superfamily hydrolase (TIGR01450 family) n=1 Tax=Saccharomonospora amisosensis TaxID=1128677 RepID=A0A7X5ZQK1_9PSEU|nr:HAD superfamily hydrolase (TIGR01450 family) [Saccharomonospora amisosensis]